MKTFLQLFQDRRLHLLAMLILVSLIIWFAGPYIAIAGHAIFASTSNRLVMILALAILWGINNFRLNNPSPNPTISTNQTSEALQNLQLAFVNVLNRMQKQLGTSILLRQKIPTFIVIGLSQSGKSTLLSNWGQAPLASNKLFEAWLIQDALFFELRVDITHFLTVLKLHHRKTTLQNIIVTISLQQLAFKNRQIQQTEVQNLAQQLQHISATFPGISIHCLFTQCDLIDGFSEFFENLITAERQQTFGLVFTGNKPLLELFEEKFNALLKQLNEVLIKRLHQAHSLNKRGKIYEFLLQLEILKPTIREIVTRLTQGLPIKLQDCYFTSTLQNGSATDYLQKILNPTIGTQRAANFSSKIWHSKDYFIHNALQKILTNRQQSTKRNTIYIITTVAALILIGASGLWFKGYRQNLAIFNALQSTAQIHQADTNNPYYFLTTLNSLQAALQHTQSNSLWLSLSGFPQAKQLTLTANTIYQNILHQQLLPTLKSILEIKLQQSANAQNPSDLYSTLKTYLMLNDPQHRDTLFILQWFSQYWQQTTPQLQKDLTLHLAALLTDQSLTIVINPQIIANTRNILNQIPLTQLSYSILLDHYNSPLKIFATNPVITIKDAYTIPALFSAENFHAVYNQQIPQACQEVITGNWVLGAKTLAQTTDIQALVADIQKIYLQQYANAWSQLLGKIIIVNFTTIPQAAEAFKILSSNQSPLIQLLNTVQINTVPNDNPQFNTSVALQFQALNTFTANEAKNLTLQLTQLKNYFAKISRAMNPMRAAYIAAAQRMDDTAENDVLENSMQQSGNMPLPLQSWVKSLSTQSWQVLLDASQTYLNQVWAATVLPEYNKYLDQRYPLFKTAQQDVSLGDFAKFFGPNGIMSNFFNNYLKPFVDTTNFYWVWKTVDNQHINIPAATLEMFIRASVIEKIYFSHSQDKPFAKFTLIPISLEPGVTAFNLNVDGQEVIYQAGNPVTAHLIWPGQTANGTELRFVNQQGKVSMLTETGPWGLFKLLDKANLQTTPDPKLFKLTFDLNGNSAQYKLLADDLVNPFIPGIVNVFRCPKKL